MGQKLANMLTRAASIGGGSERDDRLGMIAGLGFLAVVIAVDVLLGGNVVLAGSFIVTPFIAALWAGTAVTMFLAFLTIAASAASGAWNMNFGDTDYDIRLALLALGGLLAIASAWARERARLGAKRLELLDDVGAVADGSLALDQTLGRVLEVIVPGFADFCMVDAIHDRRVMRSAVRAGGRADSGAIESYLAVREPSLPQWMTRPEAPFPRHPRFIPKFTDEDVRRLAHGAGDLDWMRSLGLRSSITVAMLARDRMLGALTFCTAWSDRTYEMEDVRFAQALAGRVALALDNAGLFSDLESVERRMDNVMSLLDEAVVIHDATGELVFANPAAMSLMGFDPGEDPSSVSMDQVRQRLRLRDEHGTPIPTDRVLGPTALSGGEPTATLTVRASSGAGERERWLIARAKPIAGPDGRPLYSVTAIEDMTAVKRAEFAQRLLARAGNLLGTSTDHDRMLRGLAEVAVPEFAEWCTVNVPSESGLIEQVAVAHQEADKREQMIELRERFPIRSAGIDELAEAMRSGEPQRLSALPEPPEAVGGDAERQRLARSIGQRSRILVPMTSAGHTVGALVFGNGPGGRDFDEDDLQLAVELGRRAGTAVENARLAEERSEVARILQEGLMPAALPHMQGWETAAVYQPAGEVNAVGGDFYDAFEIADGWMVIVGDVVGRGAAAASLTALARHTMRTAGSLTSDPCRALALLDEQLRLRGEAALCTAAVLVLPRSEAEAAQVSFVSAGHPLPLLLRDGGVEEVGEPGPLLGAFEGSSWKPQPLELRTGDQLIVYTDGVIEARGPNDRFGEERLREQLAGADRPLAAIGRITSALEAFLGGEPKDDVAVVAVRRSRPAPLGRAAAERASAPMAAG